MSLDKEEQAKAEGQPLIVLSRTSTSAPLLTFSRQYPLSLWSSPFQSGIPSLAPPSLDVVRGQFYHLSSVDSHIITSSTSIRELGISRSAYSREPHYDPSALLEPRSPPR